MILQAVATGNSWMETLQTYLLTALAGIILAAGALVVAYLKSLTAKIDAGQKQANDNHAETMQVAVANSTKLDAVQQVQTAATVTPPGASK